MTKFKKKSEEVEAFKWILGSPNTPKWFYQAFEEGTIWLDESLNSMIHRGEVKKTICIKYKNGVIRATNGDWIIKDSEGKIYSCTWGDFEKYYENLDNEKTKISDKVFKYPSEMVSKEIRLICPEMKLEIVGFKEDE
ncbi:hypothetical protein K9757_14305 [Clostridioides difficile]|uniref:hypothetical protein n=1 Tax=Clostridioides difficile TaxID=1496 RepID=UPI00038CD9E3|nr:hypothetical protein [Clostridioides difficile]AXU30002.1 hypothetical protein CDIF102860_00372 [Clostridioides difficile]AXU33790.1 hypothetical protein CDIF102978_00372 [Clostridioides difficile]EIS9734282.1 hypothetical protein [Clostridioides difficile]EQJ83498.1 putative phage protein [Clostridioides difficile P46]MBF9964898.1 hypothetical protein [Clostridioides difficile]